MKVLLPLCLLTAQRPAKACPVKAGLGQEEHVAQNREQLWKKNHDDSSGLEGGSWKLEERVVREGQEEQQAGGRGGRKGRVRRDSKAQQKDG